MPKTFSAAALTRQVTGVADLASAAQQSELPLAQVEIDMAQPRRAMPTALRRLWPGISPAGFFTTWLARAREEAPEAVDGWERALYPLPAGSAPDDGAAMPDLARAPYARSWLSLVGLAADIHTVGLQQRIAVYQTGVDSYRLLFGERRLLAFHLLEWVGVGDYSRIPAFVVDGFDALAQALENGSRADLNAIERARQLALLLFALNPEEAPPRGAGQPGWDWYAQAADAKRFRIPRGKADLVARALGLGSRQHISLYRQLLEISAGVAEIAEMLNWPEGKLRSLIKASAEKGQQLLTLARIEAGLEQPQINEEERRRERVYRFVERVYRIAQIELPSEIDAHSKPDVLDAIREAREHLDELERQL